MAILAGATGAVASGWEKPEYMGPVPPPPYDDGRFFEYSKPPRRERIYLYRTPRSTVVPYYSWEPMTGRQRFYIHTYRTYER
jgi:hypothetical protein